MDNIQRINIVRKAKKQEGWFGTNEVKQDEILKSLCEKNGFTLYDFYETDGVYLDKILS